MNMAKRKIAILGEDDVLRKHARPVVKFDARLHELLDDMAETMYAANGAGLAAPQVNVLKLSLIHIYPETLKLYAERLHESILALAGQELDEQRMVTEIALMADKTAINEELVRLRCHVIQLRDCLSAGVPVGRKLDFLLQEFNREVNTIASKSQDIQITRLTVDLKGELEKLREQAQNVE